MKSLPKRQSLVSQTAEILRGEIRQGTWRELLPGERALCETLQVSRNTLRSALAQLNRDGVIRSEHGAGNRILSKPSHRKRELQSHDVALLAPEAIERLRPSQTLWIGELRAMLIERGCRLHVFHGRQYFRANPGPVLQKLVDQNRHGCWILMLSNESTQRWFESKRIPAIVAGSVHSNVGLPFRDLDHKAICRHAAGTFKGAGHRKIALLIAQSQLAGDLESEMGFREGMALRHGGGGTAIIARHNGTRQEIVGTVERLVGKKTQVTALLVANALHYLTVVGCLTRLGLRIPQDVSVISRDDDLFLSYLVPEPARYSASARGLAKALARPVFELLETQQVAQRSGKLLPEFVPGESLARLKS